MKIRLVNLISFVSIFGISGCLGFKDKDGDGLGFAGAAGASGSAGSAGASGFAGYSGAAGSVINDICNYTYDDNDNFNLNNNILFGVLDDNRINEIIINVPGIYNANYLPVYDVNNKFEPKMDTSVDFINFAYNNYTDINHGKPILSLLFKREDIVGWIGNTDLGDSGNKPLLFVVNTPKEIELDAEKYNFNFCIERNTLSLTDNLNCEKYPDLYKSCKYRIFFI